MKNYFLVCFVLGSLSLFGQTYDPKKAQMLSLSCTSCHNVNANKSESEIPAIAGRDKATLYQALLDFKTGKVHSTIMVRHVKGFSNSELEQIATYYSKIKK